MTDEKTPPPDTEILPCDPSLKRVLAEYDRPVGNLHKSRSVVMAPHGMVATSHPLATQVGLNVLQAGGNAVDSAIAANAMLGLVEPMSCGIGGDLFAMYWEASSETLYGLNASGRSPYELNCSVFERLDVNKIPMEGPLSWSVPGCVDGWAHLLERFGTTDFAQLLQPAISYGEGGFPVSEIIAQSWDAAAEDLRKWPDSNATLLLDGRAPRVGEVITNKQLANSYRLIVAGGRDAFYCGSIADQIVEFSKNNGGYFTQADFRNHRSDWVQPIVTNYRGYDVWQLPPNGQGLAVLQMLNILEGFDLAAMGRCSSEYLHLLVEAKKLAYADRAKFYSDPNAHDLPIAELVSKRYAEAQRKRIDPRCAALQVSAGDPITKHGDTVYLATVDEQRNCCSLIQSNFVGFGSKVVPGDVGFPLQNRGALFALDPNHLNCLEPHKRPFHTIIPAMVTRDDKPWLVFGVMGGDMQPQGQVQVLVNLIDFGMDVQEAGDAARIRHEGSQTPTGQPMANDGGVVTAESGIPDGALVELEERGHRIATSPGAYGGYQGIMIDRATSLLHGGTDPRKDGSAAGY